MFHVLSIKGAKLCLILLTRDVKTASYQLLLDEGMIPNAFLFVYNKFLSHKA